MTIDPFLPLLSVWGIAFYIHILHCLHIFEVVPSKLLIFILFLPVFFVEFYCSLYFSSFETMETIDTGWKTLYAGKALFWMLSFVFWVYFMTFASKHAVIIKWFVTKFYQSLWLIFKAEGWIAPIPFIGWAMLYFFITAETGTLRLFVSLIVPVIISFGLIFHLYLFGGRGGLWRSRILQQMGVEKNFDIKKVGPYKVPKQARGIYYSRNEDALFIMFGRTYGKNEPYPTIIRRNMQTGIMHCFISKNIRRISFNEEVGSVFVAPWYEKNYFELSMKDLRTIKVVPNQTDEHLQTWEPMDIIRDVEKNRVYIGNDAQQALIAYNHETGKIDGILNIQEQGLVGVGGPLWNIRQSKKTRKLYFSSGPGKKKFYDNHLFEADPDTLTITKKRKFLDVVSTALEIDDENQLIYYQNGCFKPLYEVEMKTFKVIRTFKGEGHARRIRLDKKRDCLYVLGYFSGTVFSVDLKTGKRLWKRRVGGLPHGMHLEEDILWINSMEGVLRIDIAKILEETGHAKSKTQAAPA